MYFIHHIQIYANVNRKGKEMIEFISGLNSFLIPDNISLDALKASVEAKVKELNEKYPKLKPIRFRQHECSFRVDVDEYNVVFILTYSKVRGYYLFSENRMSIEHLPAISGVCEVCGCTEEDPCFNPEHNTCWWVNEEHTICSHCADPKIKDDPETVHCINSELIYVKK